MTKNLLKVLMIFVLALLSTFQLAEAQSFTFTDTHPINNSDSLEAWLKANPKAPALVQLKNLIALERTYSWNYHDKVGRHLKEIDRLARQEHSATGRAAYSYLEAYRLIYQNQTLEAVRYANEALNAFRRIDDPSGILHAYGALVLTNSTMYGNQVTSDSLLSMGYLQKMESQQATTHDEHDYLMLQLVYTRHQFAQLQKGVAAMRKTIQNAMGRIRQNPACAYARYRFERVQALADNLGGDYMASYTLNKQTLTYLRPDQTWELATSTYNLATDCYRLNRTDEGLTLCRKSIAMLMQTKPVNQAGLAGPYTLFRELLRQKGDFAKANQIADSEQKYNAFAIVTANDKKMLELQGRYEFRRRQQDMVLLEQKQEAAQRQNRIYVVALSIAGALIGLIIILGLRLRNRNRQLTELLNEREQINSQLTHTLQDVEQLNKMREYFIRILVHDMRRPLLSFRGLADLLNRMLKQQAYDKIVVISRTIDRAGIQLEAMLDNLAKWALSQHESLPYYPQQVLLSTALNKLMHLYDQLIRFQQVSISIHGNEFVQVWADPDGLELIVRNMIDNALKHGGTNLAIEVAFQQQEDGRVAITVTDNGPGIAPDKLTFLQAVLLGEVDVQPGQQGLGLGMLLMRDFARRNQGVVTVESPQGKGTRFTLSLPVATTIDKDLLVLQH